MTASRIDDDVKVLLVAHPVEIPEVAQYAIDQFVLRGGKLIAFLDPHAYFDQKHERSQSFTLGGDNAAKSSLDKLLKTWGLNMDVNRVAADTSYASRNTQTGDSMPTLLLVTRSGIDENDAATSQIDNLVLPFAGVFTGTPAEGLKETVLVKCSPNSVLVDNLVATAPGDRILQNFKPSKIEYPLAVRLSGRFKTAFPDGAPLPRQSVAASERQSVAGETLSHSNAATLPTSIRDGEVILVADTDMLNDKVCVRVQNVMGRPVMNAVNGNLFFVQSLVEQSTGDDDLISSRSRGSMSRPFTRVKEMQAKAGKQWQEKISVLETKQRETERQIKELQAANGQQNSILSPAQEKALDDYQKTLLQVGKELKQVRKNLARDTEALEFWTKVGNIATMPALVAFSGLSLAAIKTRRRTSR
jgi:ABC-type uncharacterized transport system involved in gliding motility auxiliary subunit